MTTTTTTATKMTLARREVENDNLFKLLNWDKDIGYKRKNDRILRDYQRFSRDDRSLRHNSV